MHDFLDPALGKAIPYGVYDLGANSGWVSDSCDQDTAAFAVATLRKREPALPGGPAPALACTHQDWRLSAANTDWPGQSSDEPLAGGASG